MKNQDRVWTSFLWCSMWNGRDKGSRPRTQRTRDFFGIGPSMPIGATAALEMWFSSALFGSPGSGMRRQIPHCFLNHHSPRNLQLTLYIGREPKTTPASRFSVRNPSKARLRICKTQEWMFNAEGTLHQQQNSWVQILTLLLINWTILGKFFLYWLLMKMKWNNIHCVVLLICKI